MAQGRSRHQRGRVVSTTTGGWEIHYNVYLTDPATGKPKRHDRSRVVGHAPKMRKAEAETILAAELAAVNGGPLARVADSTLSFGEWMRNFYIPMRGANWRPATRRSNEGYLKKQIYPRLEHVALRDITKFQVQMLFNHLATSGYSYNVVYHVRDIIKAALAEAVEQDVLERNVARKTVIPEIEEREKPVLPVEWYAKLLAGLRTSRDRAIFPVASFCALRPSEIFGLTWGSYQGSTFKVMNTAWRGQFQPKKIKRKNRYGRTNYRWVAIPDAVRRAIEEWGRECGTTEENALMFSAIGRAGASRWISPCFRIIGCGCACTRSRTDSALHFILRFRSSGGASPPMARKKHIRPRCRPYWDTATFEPPWTSTPRLQTRRWPGW